MATTRKTSTAVVRKVAESAPRKTVTAQMREDLRQANDELDRVAEALSNAVAMLRQEDVGWAEPGQGFNYRGLSLSDLKRWSEQIRTSLTGTRDRAPNPHMRNGFMLRHSFVWQGDMHYDNIPGDDKSVHTTGRRGKTNVQKLIDDTNNRLVHSKTARRRREHALFADGIYLVIGENGSKKLHPISLHEITDTQRDDLYEDEIVAYRITRNEARRDPSTGSLIGDREEKSFWVYVDWFTGDKPDFMIYNGQTEDVLKGHTAFDMHANKPDGAAFGSPDAIAAVVWARVIRDLIMNGVKMQDALAMFAFRVQSPSKKGGENAALELAKEQEAGSAALLGDNELTSLNTAGRGYDFGSIGFVVATMAASLHVSGIALSANTALAGSSYGAAKTLDLPGRMAMETRRAEHIEFEQRILKWYGAEGATAFFDNFDDATDEYRSVQAAMLLWSSGNMSSKAFKEAIQVIYGRDLIGAIPKGVMLPNNTNSGNRADIDPVITEKIGDGSTPTAPAKKTPKVAAAPGQGQATGAGGANHAGDLPTKKK